MITLNAVSMNRQSLTIGYFERASNECDPCDSFRFRAEKGILDKLRTCRQAGTALQKADGGNVFMFESKCGQCKLCSDEAREETRRLLKRYLMPVREFALKSKRHSVYYAVFTHLNFAVGNLREGKRDQIAAFNDWQKREFKNIVKGSLIVQEDPLAAGGDWNVHLNAILLVDGRLDYKRVRSTWGFNVEIRKLDGEIPSLIRSFVEIMKYAVKTVPSKSESHAKTNKSKAPAMIEWEYPLFMEWWAANKRFRRVRSYGELYRVKAEESEAGDVREAIANGSMKVIGKFQFDGSAYELDSIQDDNFLKPVRSLTDNHHETREFLKTRRHERR